MAMTHEYRPNARILRVSDSAEYFGLLAQKGELGTSILAEALVEAGEDELFVVSYEEHGQWQVFVGQVAADHGIVETPGDLFFHSLLLRPSTLSKVAL